MNTKLAIEYLKTQRQFVDDMTKEAFNMAIKTLKAQELNCDGCVYQDRSVRKPFVDPCIWCKRNCIDHWKGKK